ncbi:MAG: hypothetical protein ABI718_06055 [Acidobacteriota bacterium]
MRHISVFITLLLIPTLLFATHPVLAPPPGEKMLIPVALENSPGAFGALWSSDFWIRNDGDQSVDVIQNVCYLLANPIGCTIPAKTNVHRSALPIDSASKVPAALIYVSAEGAKDVLFSLRVRNVNRASLAGGTELPVVRENEFHTTPILFINVPMESNFRPMLRIYDVDAHELAEFRITVMPFSDGPVPDVADQRIVRIERSHFDDSPFVPGYAQISDLLPLSERVSILVEPLTPGLRFWSFVSVTNNESQEITTIVPPGRESKGLASEKR